MTATPPDRREVLLHLLVPRELLVPDAEYLLRHEVEALTQQCMHEARIGDAHIVDARVLRGLRGCPQQFEAGLHG